MNSRFGVVGTFVFVVAITALLLHLWQSQLVAPSGAADTAFSEEHAFATLSGLLKEQRPHTVGSAENAVVRDRIVDVLKAAGYTPEIQAAFQCESDPRNPGCAAVENIIAVQEGQRGRATAKRCSSARTTTAFRRVRVSATTARALRWCSSSPARSRRGRPETMSSS